MKNLVIGFTLFSSSFSQAQNFNHDDRQDIFCTDIQTRKIPLETKEYTDKIKSCDSTEAPADCRSEVIAWAKDGMDKEMADVEYCFERSRKNQAIEMEKSNNDKVRKRAFN